MSVMALTTDPTKRRKPAFARKTEEIKIRVSALEKKSFEAAALQAASEREAKNGNGKINGNGKPHPPPRAPKAGRRGRRGPGRPAGAPKSELSRWLREIAQRAAGPGRFETGPVETRKKSGSTMKSITPKQQLPERSLSVKNPSTKSVSTLEINDTKTAHRDQVDVVTASQKRTRVGPSALISEIKKRGMLVSTTFLLRSSDQEYLRDLADECAKARGGGGPDMSEALRALIDYLRVQEDQDRTE
jgi:hypothetical protein